MTTPFYQLSKDERRRLVTQINEAIFLELQSGEQDYIVAYFSDEDTYIRKAAYEAVGKIYKAHHDLRLPVLSRLSVMMESTVFHVRQTCINAAGEIGKSNFEAVSHFFDHALFDSHHVVRNAVIGSVKKMGEKNPKPVLAWARQYLHHHNPEIRREIGHGIELRGRTHPQDILPMLKELQFDKVARVRNTLVHVLGQIAYKKGCLETVIQHLKSWDNNEVVLKALHEIIDVHDRYKSFAYLTTDEAKVYIQQNFPVAV